MGSNRSKKADASMPILYHKILQGGEALPIGSAKKYIAPFLVRFIFIAYIIYFDKIRRKRNM